MDQPATRQQSQADFAWSLCHARDLPGKHNKLSNTGHAEKGRIDVKSSQSGLNIQIRVQRCQFIQKQCDRFQRIFDLLPAVIVDIV